MRWKSQFVAIVATTGGGDTRMSVTAASARTELQEEEEEGQTPRGEMAANCTQVQEKRECGLLGFQ